MLVRVVLLRVNRILILREISQIVILAVVLAAQETASAIICPCSLICSSKILPRSQRLAVLPSSSEQSTFEKERTHRHRFGIILLLLLLIVRLHLLLLRGVHALLTIILID